MRFKNNLMIHATRCFMSDPAEPVDAAPTAPTAAPVTVSSIVQTGASTVISELEAAGEQALADLETIVTNVRNALTGGETAEQVVTAMLNTAESLGLSLVENFATNTLSAIAALLLKALPALAL